nr:immunoglobulin heavy chain junction region [Mus musculus]
CARILFITTVVGGDYW